MDINFTHTCTLFRPNAALSSSIMELLCLPPQWLCVPGTVISLTRRRAHIQHIPNSCISAGFASSVWGYKCAPEVTYSPGRHRSVAPAPPQRAWGVWDTWFVPWSPGRSAPSSPPSPEVPPRFQQCSPWCVDPKNEPETVRKVDFFLQLYSVSQS